MWVLGQNSGECVGEIKHNHFTVVYQPQHDVHEVEGGHYCALLRGWSGMGVLTP